MTTDNTAELTRDPESDHVLLDKEKLTVTPWSKGLQVQSINKVR